MEAFGRQNSQMVQVATLGRRKPVAGARGVDFALAAVVLLHLGVSIVHGAAHTGAQVGLGAAGTAFVYLVILAGPLAGLAVGAWRRGLGAWIVAATLAAALVFGVVNHFI